MEAPPEPPPPPSTEAGDDVGGETGLDTTEGEPAGEPEGELVEEDTGPGIPFVGIGLSTIGGLAAAASVVAVGVGVAPALRYFGGTGKQAEVRAAFENAEGNAERRTAAGDAADLRASLLADANLWNSQGQVVAGLGVLGVAVGVGALIGGIVMISSNGEEADDAVAGEAPAAAAAAPVSDDKDDDDDNDDDTNDEPAPEIEEEY